MQLIHAPTPIARDLLEYAVSQTFDWPEAESVVRGHVAHVSFVTRCPDDLPRQNVIQTHCRAYAALAEFAAPIALLWPDAGRLIPTARLATVAGGRVQPADTCITFRTYPLEGTEAGRTLCDSVGLHAFNLPDLQLTTDGEPDEAVSRFLFQLAEDFFRNGCILVDGGSLPSPPGEAWSAHFRSARFPPERQVIELSPSGGAV